MNKSKKNIIIGATILILITLGGFGSYKYIKYKDYKALLNKAEAYMEIENYDKAIENYEKTLDYKNNKDILDKINLAKEIKESKANYEKAMESYNKKDYVGALELFKKVSKRDNKRFNLAQDKIKECIKIYVNENLDKAKALAKDKKSKEAYSYLDKVLSIDKENIVAKNLKDQYIKEEKELQEEIKKAGEEEKKVEEEQKKQAEEEKKIKEENKNLQGQVTTKKKAEEIVKNKIGTSNNNMKTICEGEEVRQGVSYYLVHVYEVVENHTATIGWYYVRKDNGQVFLWDLASDILKPI
ncbi:tetratricopeptide repeat protein [Clostridium botulinum]|uniref:TPR domain protein n=2 Tax=Clostridium botulinum TaxID=1491 RepID=C1FLN9_CLOBJ|nr:tetratricopeptide repeat protein [Clostridium botulinum]ACO87040.1 TPR domain protein [Clostridium botulinum A2 str. Kyoto]AUN06562.1 tetratricopeptide repeat protein [Clostridium botulinum]EPS56861.1 TPR domain-containing protein [Clostridium botulinum Af84]MBN3349615.1 tetratricopeptide repeat protein [Clostridium botulinum]MBN3358618.1 tetratricopeptide repeat protein [Clostridium botulinum]